MWPFGRHCVKTGVRSEQLQQQPACTAWWAVWHACSDHPALLCGDYGAGCADVGKHPEFFRARMFDFAVKLNCSTGVGSEQLQHSCFHGKATYDSVLVRTTGVKQQEYAQIQALFWNEPGAADARARLEGPTSKDQWALVRWYSDNQDSKRVRRGQYMPDQLETAGCTRLRWHKDLQGLGRPSTVPGAKEIYKRYGLQVIPLCSILRRVYVLPDFTDKDYYHVSVFRWPASEPDTRKLAELEGARYNMGVISD